MAHVGLRRVVERLRRGMMPGDTDGQLLERYIAHRDDGAFAELVQRHGPKVYAVCRRVLGHHQLAEDAYQAVFVVLAKKASAIQPPSAVGGFLYGVARKAALEAFAVSRRRKETLVGALPDSPKAVPTAVEADVLAMLDEEIANLSETLRAAVVLCELDGVSRAAAARQLGIAEGTLSSRLAAARKQLADRLKKRGVTLSTSLFAALTASATAAPPLLSTTTATIIAGGVMRTLMLAKLKLATTVCVLLAAFAAWSFGPPTTPTATAAPVPKVEPQEELIWAFQRLRDEVTAYKPDGTLVKKYELKGRQRHLGMTPDGRIVFAGKNGKVAAADQTEGLTVHLRKPNDDGGLDTGLSYLANQYFRWSPDMTRVVRGTMKDRRAEKTNIPFTYTYSIHDFKTGREAKLDLPEDHFVSAWSPDMKWLLVVRKELDSTKNVWKRFDLSTKKLIPLVDKHSAYYLDLSPDGKELVGLARPREVTDGHFSLFRFAVDTGTANRIELFVAEPQDISNLSRAHWSPDGRQILIGMREQEGEDGDEIARFMICDRDGGNFKTIVKYPKQFSGELYWFGPRKVAAIAPAKPKIDGLIWTYDFHTGKLTGYESDGTKAKELTLKDGRLLLGLTPDGQRILFAGTKGKLPADPTTAKTGLTLHLRPVGEEVEGTDLGITFDPANDSHRFQFSRDGTKLIRSRVAPGKEKVRPWPQTHAVFDLATKKETAVEGLDNCVMIDVSSDGTWALALESAVIDPNAKKGGPPQLCKLFRAPLHGDEPKLLVERPTIKYAAISPDGKTVLFTGTADGVKVAQEFAREAVHSLDVATGKVKPFADHPMQSDTEVAWSPDGRIAYLWLNVKPLPNFTDSLVADEAKLVACDADGKNPITWLVHDYGKNEKGYTQLLGWFPKVEEKPKHPIAAPLPKAKPPEGTVLIASFVEKYGLEKKGLRAFRPDGTLERDVTPDGPFYARAFRASPVGRQVAFTEFVGATAPRKLKGWSQMAVRVLPLDGSGAMQTLTDEAFRPFLAWAPKGKGVYLSDVDPAKFDDAETKGNTFPYRTRLIDPATGEQTPVALSPEHAVIDVSADGKMALTISIVVGTNEWGVYLVPLATMKPETIREPAARIMFLPRLSPDGKAVLGIGSFANPKEAKGTDLYVYDVATKKESRIELPKEAAKADRIEQHAWSPDGKRVVFSWREQIPKPKNPHRQQGLVLGAGPLKWYADRITTCDRDGSNPVSILQADDNEEISAIEWADMKLPDADKPDAKKQPIAVPLATLQQIVGHFLCIAH